MKKTLTEISAREPAQRGFSLVELMIAVVIIGILSAIAMPAYTQYIVKAKRAAAQSFIMGVANKQEQYLLNARAYATSLAALGLAIPADIAASYTVTEPIPVTASPPGYTITAVPIGNQAAKDTLCGSLSINQLGTKTISGTGSLATCW